MQYPKQTRRSVAFCLLLLMHTALVAVGAFASENDPDITDNHRVETAEEAQEKEKKTASPAEKETKADKKNNETSLYDDLQALVNAQPNSFPLKDAIAKALADIPDASDQDTYNKIRDVMKKFPDDKEMPFYRLIRDRLRIFKPLPYHAGLMPCPVTPGLKPSFIPDSPILKSGNLLRKPGLARRALGQYVEVTGRVLDERCVPIENAVIEIWQADHTGKNENDYVVSGVWDVKDPDYDKYFAYSGTAQTNNVGEFSFLTIFPGTSQEQKTQAPHINVRVIHPKFEPVTTRLYFAKHPRNDADEELLSLSANKKTGQDDLRNRVIMDGKSLDPTYKYEGRRYQQTITLQGIDPYRGY